MKISRYLITGATGLIGSALVRYLAAHNPEALLVLPVRNIAKAESMFSGLSNVSLHECDIVTTDFEWANDVNYIIHCAAPTDNRYFMEYPIETYTVITHSTQHLLEYCTRHTSVMGVVYLSSLEVYGTIAKVNGPVAEENLGHVDLTLTRSCYPIAKRAAEHLCSIYAHQHGVPVSIARLTQTTGPGVSFNDNRVINAFCRSAAIGQDIVLFTTGKSSRPYCHVEDAVSAIMLLLERGAKGEVYNVANEKSYISAHDLALFIKKHFNPNISVKIELKSNVPFASPSHLPLSTAKLQSLGWSPTHSLHDMCKDVFIQYKNMM